MARLSENGAGDGLAATSSGAPRRVLIVRIGAMGDVLHAMPAVAALRARHPEWFIGWAIEPRWSALLQVAGDSQDISLGFGGRAGPAMVDRWFRVPTGAWKHRPLAWKTLAGIAGLRRELREERFDLCVDMQGSLKSAGVGRLAGARVFAGMKEVRERGAALLYGRRLEVRARHVVEQGCELLGAALGEELQPERVTLPMDEVAEVWAERAVGAGGFAMISPGAGWGAKIWPAERFGAVAAELGRAGFRVLVNASPGADELAERVVRTSDGFARRVECSLVQLIAMTRRAAVVIAGDTGPLHLAAALERPVVGIYGPTDPLRNGPWGTRARVLRDSGSVTSHKRLQEPEDAMLRIRVEEVVAVALEMLRPDGIGANE